jgi:excisionase family DNA binding protein
MGGFSMAEHSILEQLLTEREVAALLSVKVPTLRRWRWAGKGPAFRKIGAAVRYHPADLEAFVEASRRQSTADLGEAA